MLLMRVSECSVMQCVAVTCSAAKCVAIPLMKGSECSTQPLRGMLMTGNKSQFGIAVNATPVALWCSALQCVAVCCSVLQCGAVWCSVVQCVAVRCSVVQCNTARSPQEEC